MHAQSEGNNWVEMVTRNDLPPAEGRLQSAHRSIRVSGYDCSFVLGTNKNFIFDKLKAGILVRVLCVDPEGPGAQALIELADRHRSLEEFRRRILDVEATASEWRSEVGPERLQLGFLPFLPSQHLFLIDCETPSGEVKVELSTRQTWIGRPHLSLSSPEWRRYFVEDWKLQWSCSRDPFANDRAPRGDRGEFDSW